MSLKNIKEGWLNYVKSVIAGQTLDKDLKREVDHRAKICQECPELRIYKFTPEAVRGKCKKCGCAYPALVFAPNKSCPIGKWNKYEPK